MVGSRIRASIHTAYPMVSAPPIYVVDDDPAILHSTRFLFESEGHRVETFASGFELLSAFPGPCPLCVLLDHVMPGMDGLEVCQRLRDINARVPVILITGHPNPRIRTRAREAGVPLIDKPLAFEALVDFLAAVRTASAFRGSA